MISKQAAMVTAASAAITLLVTMGVGYVVGVFEKGMDADTKALIVETMHEELRTPGGKTHSEALNDIDRGVLVINTKMDRMEQDIEGLRDAIYSLSQD